MGGRGVRVAVGRTGVRVAVGGRGVRVAVGGRGVSVAVGRKGVSFAATGIGVEVAVGVPHPIKSETISRRKIMHVERLSFISHASLFSSRYGTKTIYHKGSVGFGVGTASWAADTPRALLRISMKLQCALRSAVLS